jgi:single-strand DNA-binding protein
MADTFVQLVGNLTDDPEVRFTPAGTQVGSFRLAVTPRVREGEGWKNGETSYFTITCWRDLASHTAESLSKGDRALVIGRLKTRAWETPEGERRSVVEVEADEIGPSLRWATAKPDAPPRPGPQAAGSTTTHRSEIPGGEAGTAATFHRPGLAHHRK